MKIGYFCNITNWKKKPYAEILNDARDIAIYCDKNNWNSIWFTEHHFNHEGMESQPNPLMMCTDVAARTKQIRFCLLYTSPSPRDGLLSRMPSSA